MHADHYSHLHYTCEYTVDRGAALRDSENKIIYDICLREIKLLFYIKYYKHVVRISYN